jgi:MFS family permease
LVSSDQLKTKTTGVALDGYDRRLMRNVYVLSITMGIMTLLLGWQSNLFSIYIYNGLGATPLEVGIFFSVASFAHALSGFPASLVSDKRGRKKFVIAGTFINGFVYMSYALCNTWILLMIPLFIYNLTHAAYINPMFAMLAESAPPKKRGIAFGSFQTISGVISLFAPVLAVIIILQFGEDQSSALRIAMPYLFLMAGVTVLAMAMARGLALRETHIPIPGFPQAYDTGRISEATGVQPLSDKRESSQECDSPGLRSRSVIGFYAFVSLAAISFAVIGYFIPIYGMGVLGFTLLQIGILTSIGSGVSTLVQIPTGRLADSSKKKIMLIISVLLYALAIELFLRATDFNEFILAQIPYSAAGTLLFNTEFTMISSYSARRNRSTAFSIQTAINDIASIPWPFVGGLLFSISPQLPFMFSLAIAVPVFVVCALFVHEPSRPMTR